MIGDIVVDNIDASIVITIACIPIYKHPNDYPTKFVARLFDGTHPTPYVILHDDYEGLTNKLPAEMIPFPRHEQDDPVIIETWI